MDHALKSVSAAPPKTLDQKVNFFGITFLIHPVSITLSCPSFPNLRIPKAGKGSTLTRLPVFH